MTPKFNMTREQSIFVAKRNIVDYIYKSAKLEGLAVTYPDTEAIFQGAAVPGVKVSDIIAVNNLKHAWQFLLDTLDVPMDYAYLCKLNQLVGGTKWKPEMPVEDDMKARLKELQDIKNPTEHAIAVMLYSMRGQFYLDGNKRTAMLAANQIMIANGHGIISVPEELIRDFTQHLINFYESGESETITQFVYDNCIDGMPFTN